MCDLMVGLAMGAGMLGSIANYAAESSAVSAQNAANDYNAAVAMENANLADKQAKDALERGEEDAEAKKLEIAAELGKEKAAYGASGVELSGTPTEKLSQTSYWGQQDVNTIHDNAEDEAWGYDVQKNNYLKQANMLQASKQSVSPFSIITGMSGVATKLIDL